MEDKSKEIIPTNNKTIMSNKIQADETSLATNPTLLPAVEEYEDKVSMYNTAELNSIGSRKYLGKLDQITGTVELILEGRAGSIIIRKIRDTKYKLNNNPLKIFGPGTEKLFRYITVKLTEQTLYKEKVTGMTETIKIEVAEYQKIIGRKDYNSVRDQIEKGLEIFYGCSLRFKGIKTYRGCKNKKKYDSALVDARIITRKAKIEWGVFYIEISTDIVSHLVNSKQIMQLHKYYWKASGVASEILYKISTLTRINKNNKKLKNKKNRPLRTTTLLKAISSLPTYKYVMKQNDGHTGRRIINPLEKGLEELEKQKIIKWEYCNRKGKRLTNEQLGIEEKHLKDKKRVKPELDWKVFSEIYIKITMI
jgi:hypothetical protein